MALISPRDAVRPSPGVLAAPRSNDDQSDDFALDDFEEELKRLSAVNQELLNELHDEVGKGPDPLTSSHPDLGEISLLRQENAALRAHVEELEIQLQSASGQGEEVWLERQREYEMLLEEKSEVIRSLHQKIHQVQESAPTSAGPSTSPGTGQAEEIFRLKREMEEQRRQLEQDEDDMMAQLRQMELTMAKERAEMARQRQDMARQQSDLVREIEMASRDPALRERLQHLRRNQDAGRNGATPAPVLMPARTEPAPMPDNAKKSNGLLKRFFG